MLVILFEFIEIIEEITPKPQKKGQAEFGGGTKLYGNYNKKQIYCAGFAREKYSHQAVSEQNEDISNFEMDEEIIHFEDAEQVHYGLGMLSLPHREVLTLYFLEDFSLHELAEILEVSPGTVKSRLYYAKRDLRNVLERDK